MCRYVDVLPDPGRALSQLFTYRVPDSLRGSVRVGVQVLVPFGRRTVVGVAAGVVCALAIGLKERFGYDDSLDVVGVHLVGGLVGCLMIGFVATDLAPSGVNGLFFGGGLGLLGKQAVASLSVLAYSFVVTYVLAKLIDTTIGFRIAPEHEEQGIDHHSHKEMAYDLTALVSLVQPVGEVSRRKASMASVTDG